MTADEKMTALANYVRKNFKYTPNYNGAVVDLVSKKGAYFENYIADCITATNIMCRFANLLGLKASDLRRVSESLLCHCMDRREGIYL